MVLYASIGGNVAIATGNNSIIRLSVSATHTTTLPKTTNSRAFQIVADIY